MIGRAIVVAVLVLAPARSVRAQADAEPLPRPWDRVVVESPSLNLDDSLDLRPAGVPRTRRLRLVRRNETLVEAGRSDSRIVAEATFRRVPVKENGVPGEELVEWESYRFGMAQGGAPLEPVAFPGAQEIAFRFLPDETDLMASPVDVSAAAPGIPGLILQAMVLDAMTWDYLLADLVNEVGERVAIGTASTLPGWDEPRPLPGPDGKPAGTYRLGPTRIEVAGLTRVRGEPCVLLWFRVDEGEVAQSFEIAPVSIATEGREWFQGTFAVSLVDGRVVAGELWGAVVQRVETTLVGGAPSSRPNTTLQSIAMWEID